MEEQWKCIIQADFGRHYQVSNFGRVRRLAGPCSIGRRRKEKLLRPGLTGAGYYQHWLCANAKKTGILTHHLVAFAFIGPPPGPIGRDGWQINHRNGIKTDNRAENLEWCTASQNQIHAADIGLKPRGEMVHTAKLTTEQVLAIRARLARGELADHLAGEYGCSGNNIRYIGRRKYWRHI